MRKVMLLAAMLAMVLAAAAPALAQTAVAGNVQYVDCDQIAAAAQYQYADAEDFSAIAQELGVTQEQILACLGDVNIGATATATATAAAAKTATAAAATATATATATASPTATATATLPPTGGVSAPSALALGAGALLVAGGLLARRIVR